MENVSINWARDLPASARTAIEKLLGRSLRDDEEVSIMALDPHPAPSGEARRASAERLKGALDQLAHKAKHVADEHAFQRALRHEWTDIDLVPAGFAGFNRDPMHIGRETAPERNCPSLPATANVRSCGLRALANSAVPASFAALV